jgi:putative membrane protein
VHFVIKNNYEFIIYIGVIAVFLLIFVITNKKVYYPNVVLWGLTIWGVLHMMGGSLFIDGTRLYEIILIPLSDKYPVFRYDQFVHIIGFGVATATMYYVLRPLLRIDLKSYTALSIIVVAAGFGVGAFNEMVEFLITVIVPDSGVGGYTNTSLDLVADFIGALIAVIIIQICRKSRLQKKNNAP